MNDQSLATLDTWLVEPMEPAVAAAVDRLRRLPGAKHIAIMPDVHLANDVCVGTVLATERWVYPQAVGGDIGCGLLAVTFDVTADRLADPAIAGTILALCGERIPPLRRSRRNTAPWPAELREMKLSLEALTSTARDAGAIQLGTLGSGNHFVELQADENDTLWLLIHSGSRAMGQAIRDHHLARAELAGQGLKRLEAETPAGTAYLQDVAWARAYADANRRHMASVITGILNDTIAALPRAGGEISIDHNHVAFETHGDEQWWVHRKGAMPAPLGGHGVILGSMGTATYHVEGRGHPAALYSSAHGAGRRLSREAARRAIGRADVLRQMHGVWFDYRMTASLREESPAAYKDVGAVMRAQGELVKVRRTLRPVLNYKGH